VVLGKFEGGQLRKPDARPFMLPNYTLPFEYLGEVKQGGFIDGIGVVQEERANGLYVGNFKNGRRHGPGVFRDEGGTWVGTFEGGLLQGDAIWESTDGKNKYHGAVKNGKAHGAGKMITPQGTIQGEWVNNQQHGWFVFEKPDGRRWEEFWMNNEMLFKKEVTNEEDAGAALSEPDSRIRYELQIGARVWAGSLGNSRSGIEILPKKNGRFAGFYCGDMRNDCRDGYGLLYTTNGHEDECYLAMFEKGVFHGRLIKWAPMQLGREESRISVLNMNHGQKQGFGVSGFLNEKGEDDGDLHMCLYRNGRKKKCEVMPLEDSQSLVAMECEAMIAARKARKAANRAMKQASEHVLGEARLSVVRAAKEVEALLKQAGEIVKVLVRHRHRHRHRPRHRHRYRHRPRHRHRVRHRYRGGNVA